MNLLLDTHIWIKLESDVNDLSENLIHKINNSNLFVSDFSIWEIALLLKRNRLKLNTNLRSWVIDSCNFYKIEIIPNKSETLINSVDLAWNNNDTADRIIIATALENKLKLATHDRKIISSNLIEIVQ